MIYHENISDRDLRRKIRNVEVQYGGNRMLKIYGLLSCTSGKRMKRTNRVFFTSEAEAMINGYRPCGHCMAAAYKKWKQ